MEGETVHLTADRAFAHCDENTIGVVAILGSTFDGSYEPVREIADALDALESGRDFHIPRVQSINASGHKYGLVYPGVGWAIWRDKRALPRYLVFDVNYLGGHVPTFSMNFSRPGSEAIARQYMFTSWAATATPR